MDTNYEISLNMKTLKGIETYGCFSVGECEEFCRWLYASLEGSEDVSPDAVITIDLLRRENGIPFPLALRHCNYDQLARNVQVITRELFKRLNLEE